MQLETERLTLVLEGTAEVLARIEELSPEDRAQVSEDWLARVRAATTTDPWLLGFRVALRTDGTTVGNCGFKGPPDGEGVVEIAYGISSTHQGNGYATEAAQALVAYARSHGEVRLVRAHTLPEPNASTRVLTKCGFQQVGEVQDPEDGLVWRWERP